MGLGNVFLNDLIELKQKGALDGATRVMEIGADRIMFSTDWPFENIDHAANWFDACPISEHDRLKIGRENARRLFRLSN